MSEVKQEAKRLGDKPVHWQVLLTMATFGWMLSAAASIVVGIEWILGTGAALFLSIYSARRLGCLDGIRIERMRAATEAAEVPVNPETQDWSGTQ